MNVASGAPFRVPYSHAKSGPYGGAATRFPEYCALAKVRAYLRTGLTIGFGVRFAVGWGVGDAVGVGETVLATNGDGVSTIANLSVGEGTGPADRGEAWSSTR